MALFAYIDPGTGSLFIQAILGAVLASIVILRQYIARAYYKARSVFAKENVAVEKE